MESPQDVEMQQRGEQPTPASPPASPPLAAPLAPPLPDAELTAAMADVVVRDKQGRMYVTLLPQYSCASEKRYRCVLVCRVVVCLLACAVLVLCVVGDVVPFCNAMERYPGSQYAWYYIWPGWEPSLDYWSSSELGAMIGIAMVTMVLAIVSVVLLAVFTARWRTHERERRADEALCRCVCAHFGRPRPGHATLPADPLLYANQRVENRGLVANVPLEQRELRRRKRDWDLSIAIFSMLLLTATLALVMLCMMEANCYAITDFAAAPGPALYGVAMGVALVASIVFAIPDVANVLLCRSPSVERSVLMVAHEEDEDDEDAAAALQLLQRLGLTRRALRQGASGVGFGGDDDANPLMSGVQHGIPVALPGPSVDTLTAQQRMQQQNAATQRESDTAAPPSTAQAENGGYCSAAYFQAPPQLFNVQGMRSREAPAVESDARGGNETAGAAGGGAEAAVPSCGAPTDLQ